MSRNLISEASTIKVYSSVGTFATGDTMSIEVYKDGSVTAETLTTGTVSQIGTTGIFYWPFSDLVTAPTALSEYFWVMSDATTKKESGKETFGGYPELLLSLPQEIDPIDSCRVTTNLYDISGGISPVSPSVVFEPNRSNHIELKTQFHTGTTYFYQEKIKPSFTQDVSQAYWVLPQGAIVEIFLESFAITKTTKTIPAQSTIDLFDLLAL